MKSSYEFRNGVSFWELLLFLVVASSAIRTLAAQDPVSQIQSHRGPCLTTGKTYDVVSVRRSKASDDNFTFSSRGDSFAATNVHLQTLLQSAYNVREGLISGLPGWTSSSRFDIGAKIVDSDLDALKKLTRDDRRAMLAAILCDRLHLKVHKEMKLVPVYELVITKSGSKVEPHDEGFLHNDPATKAGGSQGSNMNFGNGEITANAMPISSLASHLSELLDRNVIDKTGLPGTFDFVLKWTPDQIGAGGTEPSHYNEESEGSPSLFTALKEQLGLKLTPSKGMVESLVVDYIEMPSEN